MQKLKDLYQTDQGVHCQFSSLANVVNYYNPNIKSSNLFVNRISDKHCPSSKR